MHRISRRAFLGSALMTVPVLRALADVSASGRTFMAEHGFTELTHTYKNVTHKIYRTGTGPAVVLLHELPGLSCADIGLACRIAAHGFSVYAPLFFGKPGEDRTVHSLVRECVLPSDFNCNHPWRTSKAVRWVQDWISRGLPCESGAQCGGNRIGVVGMCMTGSMPLALLPLDSVQAAVLCQPTFPWDSAALDIDRDELCKAVVALKQKQLTVLGLHFELDKFSSPKKFETLRRELKSHFVELTLLGPANGKKHPHSTLAEDYDDDPSTPQRKAFDCVMRYLDHRLSANPKGSDFPETNDFAQTGLRCVAY